MVLENTETDRHRDMMPVYFGHALCTEFSVAEITYGVGRSVFVAFTIKYITMNNIPNCCLECYNIPCYLLVIFDV